MFLQHHIIILYNQLDARPGTPSRPGCSTRGGAMWGYSICPSLTGLHLAKPPGKHTVEWGRGYVPAHARCGRGGSHSSRGGGHTWLVPASSPAHTISCCHFHQQPIGGERLLIHSVLSCRTSFAVCGKTPAWTDTYLPPCYVSKSFLYGCLFSLGLPTTCLKTLH